MYVRGYQPKTIGFNIKPVQFQIILGTPILGNLHMYV